MSTLKQMVDSLELKLSSFSGDQGAQTFLADPIDTDDLTLALDEPKMVSRGIVQVDDELLWVKAVNNTTGEVVVSPFGRGYQGTTAAAHLEGARVVADPVIPRAEIRRTLAETIENLYPDLYALTGTTFNFNAAVSTYELPAGATGVSSVSWQAIGPSEAWRPVKRWRFDPRADTTAFPSGKSIDIWSAIFPGQPIRVDYQSKPTAMVNDSDEFATVTGLGSYVEPVVWYGAAYKLAAWLDAARLQTRSVESSQRSAYVETGAASDLSKYFYALYTEHLAKARARLLQENPPSVHMTRF